MPNRTAIIIIDSGFSAEALALASGRIIAVCDVHAWRTIDGAPLVDAEALASFAGDPMGHGSIVLKQTLAADGDSLLVLVKAYGPNQRRVVTQWEDGRQSAPGWTEGYLWAVEVCARRGLNSVANCSFGGFAHAMDGTGWESFQLGSVTGAGKPGHVVVAAAGPGDGRATHASWFTAAGETTVVRVFQTDSARYNFWVGDADREGWALSVRRQGEVIARFDGSLIPANFWNNRQQVTFTIHGGGEFEFVLERSKSDSAVVPASGRFDCWVVDGGGAYFLDHVDPVLVAEPAIFPQVISVGLVGGSYAPDQALSGGKPDVLLAGGGPISFRLPEVTAAVARLLSDNDLDVEGVRRQLGKLPTGKALP